MDMNLTDIEQIIISAAREELLPRFTRVAHEFTGTLPPGVPEYRPSVHIRRQVEIILSTPRACLGHQCKARFAGNGRSLAKKRNTAVMAQVRPNVNIILTCLLKADGSFLIAGRGQLYLHGNQNLRDYAAGTLILAETGGVWLHPARGGGNGAPAGETLGGGGAGSGTVYSVDVVVGKHVVWAKGNTGTTQWFCRSDLCQQYPDR